MPIIIIIPTERYWKTKMVGQVQSELKVTEPFL